MKPAMKIAAMVMVNQSRLLEPRLPSLAPRRLAWLNLWMVGVSMAAIVKPRKTSSE